MGGTAGRGFMNDNFYEWEEKEARKSSIKMTKYLLILVIIISCIVPIGLGHSFLDGYWDIRSDLPGGISSIMDSFFLKLILIYSIAIWVPAFCLVPLYFLSAIFYDWCDKNFEKYILKIYPLEKSKEYKNFNKNVCKKFVKYGWKILSLICIFALISISVMLLSNFNSEVIFSVLASISLFFICSLAILLVLIEINVMKEYNISNEIMQDFQFRYSMEIIFSVFYVVFSAYLIISAIALIFVTVWNHLDPIFQNLVVTTSSALEGAGFEAVAEIMKEGVTLFGTFELHTMLSYFYGEALPIIFFILLSILISLVIIPDIYLRGYKTFFSTLFIFAICMFTSVMIAEF